MFSVDCRFSKLMYKSIVNTKLTVASVLFLNEIKSYFLKVYGLNRKFVRWVQPILTLGNKRPLNSADIFPLDPRLQSERLTALIEQ